MKLKVIFAIASSPIDAPTDRGSHTRALRTRLGYIKTLTSVMTLDPETRNQEGGEGGPPDWHLG